MAGGIVLGIRLGFHNHAREKTAVVLAFHQPAANQIRCHNFCRAAEERLRESVEFLSDWLVGCRSGLEHAFKGYKSRNPREKTHRKRLLLKKVNPIHYQFSSRSKTRQQGLRQDDWR